MTNVYGKSILAGDINSFVQDTVSVGVRLKEILPASYLIRSLRSVYGVLSRDFLLQGVRNMGGKSWLNASYNMGEGNALSLGIPVSLHRGYLSSGTVAWKKIQGGKTFRWVDREGNMGPKPISLKGLYLDWCNDMQSLHGVQLVELRDQRLKDVKEAQAQREGIEDIMADALFLLKSLDRIGLDGAQALVSSENEVVWIASRFSQPTTRAWEVGDLERFNPHKVETEAEVKETAGENIPF